MWRVLALQQIPMNPLEPLGKPVDKLMGSSCSWFACGACSTNSAATCGPKTSFKI